MGRAYEVRKAAMAKTSAAKAKLYSRYGKEIFQAAKTGVPDPEMNLSLKRLIDKAKKDQVPAEVVKRAIDKATSGVGDDYTVNRYEGFGPNGSTVIVDCMTDNVNRTIGEVRHCFTKTGNKLGVNGSVSHMYNEWAVISFTGMGEEETLETLLMAEIDIIDLEEEDGIITVYGQPTDLYNIKTTLEEASSEINIEVDEITMLPMNYVKLDGEDLESFNKLLAMLDEVDDVDKVYHNVELEDEE
jgi:YebC/PmpR family DNA-binding regulatory protein